MSAIRVRYQTIEFENIDIHVRCLRDNMQFDDPFDEALSMGISSAQWPLFGVIWDSSIILALEMENFPFEGKRILEIGCGIGLSSLILKSRHANITATDIHPEAGGFLLENVKLNDGIPIPFLRTDWNDPCERLGKFDVIIGSDVLYERNHIELLSKFINRHASPQAEVIIVDPGRSNHAAFSKQMLLLNYTHSQCDAQFSKLVPSNYKGKILKYNKINVSKH